MTIGWKFASTDCDDDVSVALIRKFVDAGHRELDTALADLNVHLDKVNPSERRKDRLLGFVGSAVGNLLLLGVLVMAVVSRPNP
jgi:uncharacterized SAM-dependent methyltransferase